MAATAGSIASQGLGVATGLQKSFNWGGVAAAGVGAGFGSIVGQQIHYDPVASISDVHNNLLGGVTGMASLVANAATRSLISGTDFGDNIMGGLPDTIGQTIGNMMVGATVGKPTVLGTQDVPQPGQGGGQVGSSDDMGTRWAATLASAEGDLRSSLPGIGGIDTTLPYIAAPQYAAEATADYMAQGLHQNSQGAWVDGSGVESVIVSPNRGNGYVAKKTGFTDLMGRTLYSGIKTYNDNAADHPYAAVMGPS